MRAEFTPDNHYAGLLAQAKALFRITQSQEAIISTLRSKLTELESQLAMVGTAEIEAQRAANEQLTNEVERLADKIAGLRNDVLEEIENRDAFHEAADRLVSEVSRFFGVDIGEHSSANCPWDNAYEAIPTGDIESLKAEWKAEALEKSDVDEQAIRSAIDAIQEMHKQYDALNQVLSLDHSGPFTDAIWQLENRLVEALDVDGWLEWFVSTNSFGDNGMLAGYPPSCCEIHTVDDLIELIKEAERRHRAA